VKHDADEGRNTVLMFGGVLGAVEERGCTSSL